MRMFYIALIAALVLIGCQYDPHAHTYTTYEPSVEEIHIPYFVSGAMK
jgi:hypothetical protein